MATQIYTKTEMKLFINPDKISKQQKISLLDLYFEEIGKNNVRVRGTENQIDAYIKNKGIVLSKYFAEYNSTIIENTKIEKEEKEAEKKEKEEREAKRKIERDEENRQYDLKIEKRKQDNLDWWAKHNIESQESLINEYCEYTHAENIKENQKWKDYTDGVMKLENERGARVQRISNNQVTINGINVSFNYNKEEDLDKIKARFLQSDIQCRIVHILEWIKITEKVIMGEKITIKVKKVKK